MTSTGSPVRRAGTAPPVQSTPLSVGTSGSVYNTPRAGDSENVRRIKVDLENTSDVTLEAMLTALLARLKLGASANAENQSDFDSARESAASAFHDILNDAIVFCNGSSEHSAAMKALIKHLCDASKEADTYAPLTSFFNTVLAYGDSTDKQRTRTAQDTVLFVLNEKYKISSELGGTDRNGKKQESKLKPDIVGIPLSYLPSQDKPDLVKEFSVRADEVKAHDGGLKDGKPDIAWPNVLVSVEVKHTHMTQKESTLAVLHKTYSLKKMQELDQKQRVSQKKVRQAQGQTASGSQETNLKRPRPDGDDGELPAKRSRSNTPTSDSASSMPATASSYRDTITPGVQCANYALERLRSHWNTTHAFVILVQGRNLRLQYYDPQGLIRTNQVNIITHLPYIVALLTIFRRFDTGMWGIPKTELVAPCGDVPRAFTLDKSTMVGQKYTWIGRRTFTANVKWVGDSEESRSTTELGPAENEQPQAKNVVPARNTRSREKAAKEAAYIQAALNQPSFFKASWPEVSRTKEFEIVKEARDRSDLYLGEFKSYVKDHMPTIYGSEEVKFTSTAIIRHLLGLGSEYTEKARVLVWLVSRKLRPLTTLDIRPFWDGFRHLVRCHYLLWRIGVAHGDISLRNLMYDDASKSAILNDYDLAALMAPGTLSPPKTGWQRTGTIPFMALELLDVPLEATAPLIHLPRRYHHDLESFGWCLFWHCYTMDEPTMLRHCGETFRSAYLFKHNIVTSKLYTMTGDPAKVRLWSTVRGWLKPQVIIPDDADEMGLEDEDPVQPAPPEAPAATEGHDEHQIANLWTRIQRKVPIPDQDGWISFSASKVNNGEILLQ